MLVARFAPGRGCADCGRGGAEVRPRSILVVDDKEDIREVLALLLRSRGHTVEIAVLATFWNRADPAPGASSS